jgi:hypothetical protein
LGRIILQESKEKKTINVKMFKVRAWQLTPVILTTQEAEIEGSRSKAGLGKKHTMLPAECIKAEGLGMWFKW